MSGHSLLFVSGNLLDCRTSHQSLVSGMIVRIVLFDVELTGSIAEDLTNHQVPYKEGKISNGTTMVVIFCPAGICSKHQEHVWFDRDIGLGRSSIAQGGTW